MKNRRYYILFACALLAIVVHYITAHGWIEDDAYISYRYAENLAHGNGLVYNPGEHVEGYSNFLWVVLIAGGIKCGLSPETASFLLNLLCSLSVLVVMVVFYPRIFKATLPESTRWDPALLTAGIGSFWVWTFGGGLETILFSLCILFAVLLTAYVFEFGMDKRVLLSLSLACFLASLTRPEGVMTFAYAVSILFFSRRFVQSRGALLWLVLPFFVLYCSYLGWKLYYFGELLPNTFYAKVAFSMRQVTGGIVYTLKFFATYPLVALFMFGAVFFQSKSRAQIYIITGFTLLYTLVIVAVGGDFMQAFRMFAPLVPLFAVISCVGMHRVCGEPFFVWVLAITVCLSAFQTRFHPDFEWKIKTYDTVKKGERAGKMLAQLFPSTTKIGVTAAGALPYFSKLTTIDMLGLTNREIAHEGETDPHPDIVGHLKSDTAVVFREEPDIIMFGDGFGHVLPQRKVEQDLFASENFRTNYILRQYASANDTLRVYIRRKDEGVER